MTITVNDTRNEYTASAGQTVFSYTFKIFADTDLNVYLTSAGTNPDDSTDLITAYTVSGVGDEDGGTITLTTPASAGDLITIVSDIPESRTTDYQNNGDFRPPVVNDDFDRVVSLVKQAVERSNRGLAFQESQQNASGYSLPTPEAGYFLRWNGALNGLENVPFTSQSPGSDSLTVSSLANVTNASTGDWRYVLGKSTIGDGGHGAWVLTAGDFTTELAADTLNGVYLEYSGEDGSTRAWVRQLTKPNTVTARQLGVDGTYISDNSNIFTTMEALFGTSEYTIIIDIGTSVQTDTTIPSNCTTRFIEGSQINIDSGKFLYHLGLVDAGQYKCFIGSGDVKFHESGVTYSPATQGRQSKIQAAWWGDPTVDVGDCVTSAMGSIRYRGGTIILPGIRMTQTTSADLTDCTAGVVVVQEGGQGYNFPSIDCQATGKVAFDMTKSAGLTLINISVDGDTSNTPFTAFLMARDSTGSSYGNHTLIGCSTSGYFQGGAVYNYGSEIVFLRDCMIKTSNAAGRCIVHTGGNKFGAASDYQTIATGSQSNSTFHISGGAIEAYGSGNTDCVYLDASADFSVKDLFMYNGTGRSYFYADGTTTTSNKVQLEGIRCEVGATPTYGIYINGTGTSAFWTIRDVGIDATTSVLVTDNVAVLSAWNISGLNDISSSGITVYQFSNSYIDLGTTPLTTTNTAYRCIILGNESNITLTANSQSQIIHNLADGGQISVYHRFDNNGAGGESSLMLLDVTKGTLQRVSFGASDSGGTGYKLLRVVN